MNLESDKRLNIQLRLDFSSAPTGEARQAGREDIELLSAVNDPERPANTSRIMEEVCERENLKEALRQVRGNKGSAGVDPVPHDGDAVFSTDAIERRLAQAVMPPARSLSTSRILRMGNLCPGMPRSLSKGAEAMPIRRSPNGADHTRPQPGRDRPEWVVAINRNAWSQSIGIGGRNQPVRASR